MAAQARGELLERDAITFLLHDHPARTVRVLGSWDDWSAPGIGAHTLEPGIWQARLAPLDPGSYSYKFLVDDRVWLPDPSNRMRIPDNRGGFNLFVATDRSKAWQIYRADSQELGPADLYHQQRRQHACRQSGGLRGEQSRSGNTGARSG